MTKHHCPPWRQLVKILASVIDRNGGFRAAAFLLASLLWILGTAPRAGAATFQATFETGTVGASVPVSTPVGDPTININPSTSTAWSGSTSTLGNSIAQGYPDPVTSYNFGDGKVAVLVDNHATGGTNFFFQVTGTNANTTGQMLVNWDMMFKSGTSQAGNVWATFVDASNQTIFQIMWNVTGTTNAITLTHFYVTPGGASVSHPAGTYPVGAKLSMSAVIDLNAYTATVSMNGTPLKNTSTLQEVFPIPPTCNFAGTKFFSSGPTIRTVAVDNFWSRLNNGLVVVSGGTSSYKIYRSNTAPTSVVEAAADLQSVIQLATSCSIPIVASATVPSGNLISLGDNPAAAAAGFTGTSLPLEGFRIATTATNNNIYILGPDTVTGTTTPAGGFSRGTRNGVSTFLENEVGVRWVLPGPNGADIPTLSTLTVQAQNTTGQPYFLGREFDYVGDSPGTNPATTNEIDKWIVRNKLGKSTDVERGHSWDSYPSQAVLIANPVYMAQLSTSSTIRQNPQDPPTKAKDRKFCTTNTGLIAAFSTTLAGTFTAQPTRKSLSLSPTDGLGGCFCNTANCLAHIDNTPPSTEGWGTWGDYNITRTRQILKWYNDIATYLNSNYSQHNGKRLGGYLYNEYTFPPEGTPTPTVDPRIELYFAPRHLYGMALLMPANATQYQNLVAAWEQKYANQMSYSDYPMWAHDMVGAPLPAGLSTISSTGTSTLGMIMNAHKAANTNHMIINSNSAWGWTGLKHYIVARMLWNPNLDPNVLKTEFLTRAYGPAAGKMGEIYDIIEDKWKTYMTTRPVVAADWMTDLTNYMIAGAVVPAYWDVIAKYQEANAMTLTSAQRARLEMFGDNLKVLTWRLRHMGVPGINSASAAPVYLDDGPFWSWTGSNLNSLALQQNWASTNFTDYPNSIQFQNDNPKYNVTHDDYTTVTPGTKAAVPLVSTATNGVMTRAQTATVMSGTTSGCQIWYDYKDSVNTTVGLPSTRQLVLKNNASVEFIAGEWDSAAIGVMEIRWQMMVDSMSSGGLYFLTLRDTKTRNIAAMKVDLGLSRIEALAYSAPNTFAPNVYTLVSTYTKGTVITMKVRLDFTQTIPKAEYYVDDMVTPKLVRDMPKWCDFRRASFGGTSGVGTVATDNWYIGR